MCFKTVVENASQGAKTRAEAENSLGRGGDRCLAAAAPGLCVRDGDRRPAAVHSKGSQPPTCPCARALRVDVTHFRCFVSGGKELCGLTGGRGGRLLTVAPPTWSAFYEEVCVRRLVFSLAGRGARASVPPRGVAGPYIATVPPFPGELGSDSVSERWKHTSSVRHHTLPALSSRLEHRRVDYAQKEQSGPLRHRGRDPEGQAELGDGEVAGPECWGPHDSQV